jgi:uncharacterized protein YciI
VVIMFVLDVTYNAPLERIDAALPAHAAWLDEQYAAGIFLASGRKVPRTGGVILADGPDRATIETLVQTDPFWRDGLASYEITEFLPTKTGPALSPHRVRL